MLNDLGLVDDFDGVNLLGLFVSDFVNFSKTTDSNIRIGKRLEVVAATLALLAMNDRG